jgi:NADH:ubiquinone oxidoreductase subunit E
MKNELTIICEETGFLGDRRFQAITVAVKRETEKAIEVVDKAQGRTEWVPKSQIKQINGFAKIPQWLWDRKGFKWFGQFSILPRLVEA